ncbi:MAG: type II toxin-antitoxin system Phd/YefM family antitoxin [Kiritimatiellaceae bacterium]|nr:type II toxin-antitoxin system Phd/YefM family antitoxin [Kiritimatiellaceae bacterium]
MSITVTAVKARQNLGELLNLVSIKHEEVIIERAGKKIARLTAIEESAVSEPVAEAYAVKKKGGSKIDFSEFFGTWDDEEYRRVTEAVNEFRRLRGAGKEMWESTGQTPDEYVRKEREEWD